MAAEITAILLAAGESRRMGQPKMLLPWGETTVLGQVVRMFSAGLSEKNGQPVGPDFEILVVTGGTRALVEAEVVRLAGQYPLRIVYNPNYALGGMVSSIQAGLAALGPETRAALIGLGDQPQVRQETVRKIWTAFTQTESSLIIPSFQNRRGHPWLADRKVWPEILALPPSTNPRQFLDAHAGQIQYVAADESILQDLDTPEDYHLQRPS
jgi:molybdenum cofactor cytidylyltransferase